MKRIIGCLLVGCLAVGSLATDSRIISLGRHDAFFMDDYSIFRNPANVSIYPNMLIGSPGVFRMPEYASENDSGFAALRRENRDAQRPYAGGIISYSFNQSAEAGSQYPMISLVPVLNRYDEMLEYIIEGSSEFEEAFGDSTIDTLPFPLGKLDLLAGIALKNGGMIGAGGYFAFQKGYLGDEELKASLVKILLGTNWPIAKSTDIEASVGLGLVSAIADSTDMSDTTSAPLKLADFSTNRDFLLKIDVRLFSAMSMINGDIVPHLNLDIVNFERYSLVEVNAGVGVNINVDKGFGWGGVEFIHETRTYPKSTREGSTGIGGRLSFGFERNLLWDWFLLRAGVSKKLLYVTDENGEHGRWSQNPEGDASDDDHIGVGIGFNVENRLKIDLVVAEDFFYTFTNLISGPQDHLFTRFSITYSF